MTQMAQPERFVFETVFDDAGSKGDGAMTESKIEDIRTEAYQDGYAAGLGEADKQLNDAGSGNREQFFRHV